jgi:hypothetical protein
MMGRPLIWGAVVDVCRFIRDLVVFLSIIAFAVIWTAMELLIRGRRWMENRK